MVLVGLNPVCGGTCTWWQGLSPIVSLGTEAEAQEGTRRMKLVPCKVCVLALLQPLRLLLLPLPGTWGWHRADPAVLLQPLLTLDSREYHG